MPSKITNNLMTGQICLFLATQSHARIFQKVGTTKGLDARVVTSMTTDQEGYLWIGSREGLFRYDGCETRTYLHNGTQAGTISDNDIRNVFTADDSGYGVGQDTEGWIWAATQKGLSRLNPETGEFEHFSHQPDDPGSLSHNWAYDIHRGSSGDLWISTVGGGLNRWNS